MCYYWKSTVLVLILSQEAPKQLALPVVTGETLRKPAFPMRATKTLAVVRKQDDSIILCVRVYELDR